MQRYIEQLINDLRQATWRVKPPDRIWEESEADPNYEIELEDISYVEKYIYGERELIGDIAGIDRDLLPPPKMLTKVQKATLADELKKMLKAFNFYLDFPAEYPSHLRYKFIRDFWNQKHVVLSFGENHIEFCDYDESHCPFPGYCKSCSEFTTKLKADEDRVQDHENENDESNLPF